MGRHRDLTWIQQTAYTSLYLMVHKSVYILGFFLFHFQTCSSLCSLPGVWTLLRPQGPLPLWLSLPTPLGQQDLHVLLSSQQHGFQVLLQRDWVPGCHADQPHHHLRRIHTQVSYNHSLKYWRAEMRHQKFTAVGSQSLRFLHLGTRSEFQGSFHLFFNLS